MNAMALFDQTTERTNPNATGATDRPRRATNHALAKHTATSDPTVGTSVERTGFAEAATVPMVLSLLVVFTVAAVSIRLLTDNATAAVGFGAYVAFWLGGGFGFLIGGIRWGLAQEQADAQERPVR